MTIVQAVAVVVAVAETMIDREQKNPFFQTLQHCKH
jgi:hypothetical protein